RRDDRDHAERLARDLDADAGTHRLHDLARDAQRLAGEELEDVRGADHFAGGLGQRLAFFARQQVAELGLAVEDFAADRIQRVEALLRRAHRPAGKGGLRGADRVGGLLFGRAGVAPDDVARVGRVGVRVFARALGPG